MLTKNKMHFLGRFFILMNYYVKFQLIVIVITGVNKRVCLRMRIITLADTLMRTYRSVLRLARYIHRKLHASGKVTSVYQRFVPCESIYIDCQITCSGRVDKNEEELR
jgi:hypothetical protein